MGTAVLMVNRSLPVHQRAQTADPIPQGLVSTTAWLFHRAWGTTAREPAAAACVPRKLTQRLLGTNPSLPLQVARAGRSASHTACKTHLSSSGQ